MSSAKLVVSGLVAGAVFVVAGAVLLFVSPTLALDTPDLSVRQVIFVVSGFAAIALGVAVALAFFLFALIATSRRRDGG
jgi:hypothetical protein